MIDSGSAADTQDFGHALGRLLEPGDVVALDGELGAGKTELVRGLARGLDLDPGVIYSPSFTLVAEHEGRMALNHIDLFRLGNAVDPGETEIGLADYLAPAGVTVVEWADKLAARPWTVSVRIGIEPGERRRLTVQADSPRGESIVDALRRSTSAGAPASRSQEL